METRDVVINAFRYMSLVCLVLFFVHKATSGPDEDQASYQLDKLHDLDKYHETYLEQRPDTTNFDRLLNEEEIRQVNGIVAFIRVTRNISGPRPYKPSETYREFDARVQARFDEQSTNILEQARLRKEMAAENRQEGWMILGIAIGFMLLHLGLEKFWKRPEQEGDSVA